MFEAAEVRQLADAAGVQLKTMILLGTAGRFAERLGDPTPDRAQHLPTRADR